MYKSSWIIGIEAVSIEVTPWSLWCCYCPAERTFKYDFWLELDSAVSGGHSARACIGDFNDLIDHFENKVARMLPLSLMCFLEIFLRRWELWILDSLVTLLPGVTGKGELLIS